jgi:hypothetical protein
LCIVDKKVISVFMRFSCTMRRVEEIKTEKEGEVEG